MRPHRKPDLLFILTVFVGLGIVVSSYIQYSRANPTVSVAQAPTTNQQVKHLDTPESPLILVSNPVHTEPKIDDNNGVLVINSSHQP